MAPLRSFLFLLAALALQASIVLAASSSSKTTTTTKASSTSSKAASTTSSKATSTTPASTTSSKATSTTPASTTSSKATSTTSSAVASSTATSSSLFTCTGGTVYIIAHQDDDLLFQSPDLYTDVHGGNCVTTIIMTAGDSGTTGSTYMESRYSGNQAAYAQMLNVSSVYTEVTGIFGGQPVTVRTLKAKPKVSRVYFRLPDGNMDGSGFSVTGYESLRMLYFGSISSITNQPNTATFTLAALKQAIGQIITAKKPTKIRTLDYMSDYDCGDHADHLTTGRLAAELAHTYAPTATLAGYMGYPVQNFAPTMQTTDSSFIAKSNAFFAYTPYDYAECQSYSACVGAGRGEAYWLQRQYVVTSALAQQSYMGSAEAPVALPNGTDIALLADATASSEWPDQPASAAIDGNIRGYPGNSSAEWSSYGEGAGAWITLTWDQPYNVTSIVLNDRPNLNDWMTGCTLTFADNSTVAVGALANDGSATLVTLGGPVVTDSIFLYVTSVSTSTGQVGLAEFQVFGTPCPGCIIETNLTNSTTTQTSSGTVSGSAASQDLALLGTASSSSSAPSQGPEKAIDGVVNGYIESGLGDYTKEWASYGEGAGAWWALQWPQSYMVDSLVFHDRPNANDQITGGTVYWADGSTLAIPSLNNDGSATVVNLSTPVNTSSIFYWVNSVSSTTSSAGLAEIEAYYSLPQTEVLNTTFPAGNSSTTLPVAGDLDDETWADDLALLPGVTVVASSESAGQDAGNAINGDPNGYKESGLGDAYQEWATNHEGSGAWLQITFPSQVTVNEISLYDRPNLNDQVTSAILTFDDNSFVSVGALTNDGSATNFSIPSITTKSILFTVTGVSSTTSSVGLSEFAVYGAVVNSSTSTNSTATPTSSSIYPTATYVLVDQDLAVNATAVASSYAPGQDASKAIDTYLDGYKESGNGSPYEEWATYGEGAGATLTLTWPSNVVVTAVVLYDRPNLNDQVTAATLTFDDGSIYQVGTLPNLGTGKLIPIQNETTSSLVFTVTDVSSTTSSVGLSEIAVYGYTPSLSNSSSTNSTATSTASSIYPTSTYVLVDQDLGVNATAVASSYAPGQDARKAIDTYVDGYKPDGTGMPYEEWASYGEGSGATLTLTWDYNVTVTAVVLYDRPNPSDQVTSGTLTFDDGSVYQTGILPNLGTGKLISIDNETTSSLVFTVTGVSSTTSSVGLSEIAVYGFIGGSSNSSLANSTATYPNATLSSNYSSAYPTPSASLNASLSANYSSAFPSGSFSLNATTTLFNGSTASGPVSTGLASLNLSSLLNGTFPTPSGSNFSSFFPSATANLSASLPSSTANITASDSGFNLSSYFPSATASASAAASGADNSTLSANATLTSASGPVSTGAFNASSLPSGYNATASDSASAMPSFAANASSAASSGASFLVSSSGVGASASSSLNASSSAVQTGYNASSSAGPTSTLLSSSALPSANASISSFASSAQPSSVLSLSASLNSSVSATASSTSGSSSAVPTASASSVLPSSGSSSASSSASSVRSGSSASSSTGFTTLTRTSSSSSASSTKSSTTTTTTTTTITTTKASTTTSKPASSTVSSTKSSSALPSSTSAAPTGLPTAAAQASTVNIARLPGCTATASSFISKSPPAGAVDGNIGGVSILGLGTASQEWVSSGTKGQWIEINCDKQYLMRDLVLYDRVNTFNTITSAALNFTDGSLVTVNAPSSSGSHVSLGSGITASGVRITVTGTSLTTTQAGLAEIQIYNRAPPTTGLIGALGNAVGQTLGGILGLLGL